MVNSIVDMCFNNDTIRAPTNLERPLMNLWRPFSAPGLAFLAAAMYC